MKLTFSVAIFHPSGFMLGRMWIRVESTRLLMSWSPARYEEHR